MTVLDRKRMRDLLRARGMLLAVAAIVATGTGSFIGMLGTFNNLDDARASYYAECRMADFWIDLKKAPVAEVRKLATLPGISELRDRMTFPAILDLPDVPQPINMLVVSMPREQAPVINNILVREGTYFTENRRNEAILSEQFAEARGIHPGDTINLILDGQRKAVYVTGLAISSEFVYFAPPGSIVSDPKSYGVVFLKRDYMEDVFGFDGACNNLVGTLTPKARADGGQEAIDGLSHELADFGVFSATPLKNQFSNLTLASEMGGLQSMATMMPALFLAVAAMVLNVLMTRIAQQQRTIVGTLKALGYSNRIIFTHYIQFGVTVGFAGGLGGWAIGWWMSGYMTRMYQAVFEFPSLANTLYPGIMAAAMLISVVFAVLGTLHGVKTVAHLNPAEAMRAPSPPAGGAVFLERFPRLWKAFDFRWQMILRGVLRNRIRTLISILAAALGASIVVVALGLMDSMNKMISFQFDKIIKSDYTLSFRDETGGDAALEVRRMPGILLAEAVFNVPGTFEQNSHWKKGVITGLPSGGTLTVPHSANGEAVPVPLVGLLMTQRMADQLQLKEGDALRFTPVRGLRTPHEVQVVKIISSMLGMAVYADYAYLNHLMGESDALSEIQMKTAFTPSELDVFYSILKESPRIQAVNSIREQKAAITKQFQGSMQGMSVMLVIFAAVIFFGSILNGSLIALAERNREIATFRVLGYTPMDVGTIFLRENLLLNLVGTVVGMPLGYLLLYGMCSQFANDAFIFPTYVRGVTWINTFVLAFLFVLGAQLVVRRSILKMDWGEALSMKE